MLFRLGQQFDDDPLRVSGGDGNRQRRREEAVAADDDLGRAGQYRQRRSSRGIRRGALAAGGNVGALNRFICADYLHLKSSNLRQQSGRTP